MPYPNQHAARVRDPNDFEPDSMRTKEITDGITAIMGKLKGGDGSMVIQAYRFDKNKFTAAEAKEWLKKNDVKYISFEPAKDEKQYTMEKETRNYEIEMRADSDKGIVEGYALLFNTLSRDLGGFVEEISPNALEGVLDKSDVLAVLNHSENKGVFARSRFGKGSLHLDVDEKGLRYWWKIGKSPIHQELAEMIDRGDIFSSSFAFTVRDDGDVWENIGNGMYKRTINQFDELFDVSPVYRPAYSETTVGKRSMEKIEQLKKEEQEKIDNDIQLQEQKRLEQEKKEKELQDYYKGLEDVILKFK